MGRGRLMNRTVTSRRLERRREGQPEDFNMGKSKKKKDTKMEIETEISEAAQKPPPRKSARNESLQLATWYSFKVLGSEMSGGQFLPEEWLNFWLRCGRPSPSIDGSMYLYHGTDRDSALNILRDGVHLWKGCSSQDFSHNDGFYLNYDYEQAKKWAHIISGNVLESKVPCTKDNLTSKQPAVIIFQIEKNEVLNHLKLTGVNQKRDWQAIVKFNRSGRQSEYGLSEPLSRRFKESDYITGPVCEASRIPRGNAFRHWKPSGYESRNRQLCVRSKDVAEKFTAKFMDSILLFGEISDDIKNILNQVSVT